MSKPHIYQVNGKWYCKRKYEDGFGCAGIRTEGLKMEWKPIKEVAL